MAVLSNTTQLHSSGYPSGAGGTREDLSDMIYDLFPEDTWCLSNFDREEASATYTEWLGQSLASPAANIQVEGDDATFELAVPPARFGSYCQISSKTFLISDTLEAVAKAGRKSEVARTAIVKMRELKRDIESRIVGSGISTAGGAGTGRSTAGMEAWIGDATASAAGPSHVVLSTTTAGASTPPVTSGTPGTAITDGGTTPTTGAFTSTSLNYALQQAWSEGGDPRVILASAANKRVIDAFTSVATRFVDVAKGQEASIVAASNVYVSSFGRHQVVLNRYGRDFTVLCIDPSLWAVRYLRPFQKRDLARTGDGRKHQIIAEWALVARNWKGNAKVTALSGA
jgi:hypothetical protein